VTRRQASYAKKRLAILLKAEIIAEQASIDSVNGYVFTVKRSSQAQRASERQGSQTDQRR
jgi:hypothetical protein